MDPRLSTGLEDRYAVEREIGKGGMATVYLARDTRHKRNVALKVLNPELGAVLGAERFLAEIQVTANLQHPNLLPLFDSGEVDGLLFYVMPYVDGETLRAKLERVKQLPVQEAVRIATAIAGALAYAHRNNVIHRDLKPENILMQDGQPLIADFGIALAVSNAGGARITQTGLSLGTPQYMSPEQATGDRVVDGRADIYSLGAITYEMLVGDPPHTASTSQAVIAKLLTEKPPSIRKSRPSVPPHVDAAVACALEKLAADRYSTAREFADALEGKGSGSTEDSRESASPGATPGRPSRREIGAWSLAVLLAALLAWQQVGPPEQSEALVVRANFDLPAGMRVNDVMTGPTIAVSPSGDLVAFTANAVGGHAIYLRRLNDLSARAVAAVTGRNLAFSPDGRWLAFTEGNELKKVSVDGGEVVTIGASSFVPYGLAWDESNRIYIGSFVGIWSMPASGGEPTPATKADSGGPRAGGRWPLLLPGAKAVAYVTGSSASLGGRLGILGIAKGSIDILDLSIAMPLAVLDGYLVYVSPSGALMAVRFDSRKNRPVGAPVQLDEGVLLDPTAGVKASLSPSGTLAYLRGRSQFDLVLAGAAGAASPGLLREPGRYSNPRFSPDGSRIAVTAYSASSSDIWIFDRRRNTFTRLTTEGSNLRPEWTSDGKRIVFISTRGGSAGIWWQPADGSGGAELLYQPDVEPFEAIVSPDMQWLLFRSAPGSKHPRDILAVPMTGTKTVTALVASPFTESMPRLSPNGKWLAYQSNETGRFEIYVRPFPESGARVQVSDNGGSEPLWGRSGRLLYFRGPMGEVMHVGVTTDTEFSIIARSVALTGDYLTDASHASYDIAPDGRFLMLRRAGAESQTVIVHNWRRELRERTRGKEGSR